MYTRVVWAVIIGWVSLSATGVMAAHDDGVTVSLKGTSSDGRFALLKMVDVQHQYVDWIVSDVDEEKSLRRRFEGANAKAQERGFLTEIKRTYRIRRAPTPRHRHLKKRLEGRFYTWRLDDGSWLRSFALVGALGQQIEPSIRISCYNEDASDCLPIGQGRPKSSAAKVHWFRSGVYLVVDTWTVEAAIGNSSRALVVHKRLPAEPERPVDPPTELTPPRTAVELDDD